MVVEHNFVLSLDEIKAIRFRCRKCGACTSFKLNESVNFPVVCPGCRMTLYDTTLDTGDSGLLQAVVSVLKSLIEEKKPYQLLLEINAPEK